MVNFSISLARRIISVEAMFDSTKEFCRNYLTDEKPDFFVSISPEDIANERLNSEKQMEREGLIGADYSDEYLETLALYRKITAKLLACDVILMHGCAIEYKEKAYIFTAHSGVGKTTHSRLWIKNIPGSYILNGDKPLIAYKDGTFYACGTPWRGKERHGYNACLPIGGICFINRGLENTITKVSLIDSLAAVINQIHFPEDADKLDVLNFVRRMDKLDFYNLYCNMEDEAAILSFETMTGETLSKESDNSNNKQGGNL